MFSGFNLPSFMVWDVDTACAAKPDDATLSVVSDQDTEVMRGEGCERESDPSTVDSVLGIPLRSYLTFDWSMSGTGTGTGTSQKPPEVEHQEDRLETELCYVPSPRNDKQAEHHSSMELRRDPSPPDKVCVEGDGGLQEGLEMQVEAVLPKSAKRVSFTEEAAKHLKVELVSYLKQKKKSKSKQSTKERKNDLKKYLKKSLKAYLVTKDSQHNKKLEKTVGDMINKAVFAINDPNNETKQEPKKSKKSGRKKKQGTSKPNKTRKETHANEMKDTDDKIHGKLRTNQHTRDESPVVASIGTSIASSKANDEPKVSGKSKMSGLSNLIKSEFNRLEKITAVLDQEKAGKDKGLQGEQQDAVHPIPIVKVKQLIQHTDEDEQQVEVTGRSDERTVPDAREPVEDRESSHPKAEIRFESKHSCAMEAEKCPIEKTSSKFDPTPVSRLTRKQQELEAEIEAEVAKLQALKHDFLHKVQIKKFDHASILKSDLFDMSILSNAPLKSQKSKEEDARIRDELARLRDQQSALFARGRELTQREQF